MQAQTAPTPSSEKRNISEYEALDSLLEKPVKIYVVKRQGTSEKTIVLHGTLVGHDRNALIVDDGFSRTVIYKSNITSVTEDDEE